jgi:hypothetical protein
LPCNKVSKQFCHARVRNISTKGKDLHDFPMKLLTFQLYRTGRDPLAGTEEAFPTPNNSAKMKRSMENAEHVGKMSSFDFLSLSNISGLFAPRATRDPERRRRSNYDRGNRYSQQEEQRDTAYAFDRSVTLPTFTTDPAMRLRPSHTEPIVTRFTSSVEAQGNSSVRSSDSHQTRLNPRNLNTWRDGNNSVPLETFGRRY